MSPENEAMLALLPTSVVCEIRKTADSYTDFEERLSEISLRRGRVASLTLGGRSLPLPVILSKEETEQCFLSLCGGSVYAHRESLRRGFVMLPTGHRAGVVGRAVTEGGDISGVYDISTISIRMPHAVFGAGDVVRRLFYELGGHGGILVYAPPSGGKTTLLSDLSRSLSSGDSPRRVALIDERGELSACHAPAGCLIDTLLFYPKAIGIEIATRTLSPDVIICDEIGTEHEAYAVMAAQNSGVPLIASAHAESHEGLLRRPPIRLLWESGVFSASVGIRLTREGDERYCITERKEAAL